MSATLVKSGRVHSIVNLWLTGGWLVLLAVSPFGTSAEASEPRDWPVYRHDRALSGVSHARGHISTPEIKWEYYLGPPLVTIASSGSPQPEDVADLDGSGVRERFAIHDRTIEVSDLDGKRLWSLTVEGRPLGHGRVARLFPDRPGRQIVCFSSRMDTGEGQGYCFTFDQGVTNGRLAWTTGPLSNQYAPMLIVDDVDGDGLPDIVNAPHYRVQIFNGQTGQLKAEVPEAKGRNYGMLLTRPGLNPPRKDIFVICDFVQHVECVRFENGQWTHPWGHKYLDDENAPVPHGRQRALRVGPNPIADLEGQGRDLMIYMLLDAGVDDRWHLVFRDTQTGRVFADLPGIWLWSVADLDGDGRSELLYTVTNEKRPPTWCDVHVGRFQDGKLIDVAVLRDIHPLVMNAKLPASASSIADEGLMEILQTDLDGDGHPEFFYG